MTDTGLPHLPGVATVSEILSAVEAEYTELKFLPTQAAGGANYLKSVRFTDLIGTLCPTGGISTTTSPSIWPCRTSVCMDFTGDEGLRGRRIQVCRATAEPGVVRTAL
jgi:2-keto-3-deoxy-6-phosphogluconate aldolase